MNINPKTENIGNINPFRWRGHYYDGESGLYYANGSYYDPEVGLHVDAAPISSMINNALETLGLDINGIMCDNILAYLPYVYSAFTTLELSADPTYDPLANKPLLELAWNAVVNWFVSVVQWYNNLDNAWKIGIGLTLFALACIITAVTAFYTGGGSTAILSALGQMLLSFAVGAVSAGVVSGFVALIQGENAIDAMLDGFADAVFWGGVFAFVTAGVNAIKELARGVVRVETPCDVIGGEVVSQKETAVIGKMKDLNQYQLQPGEFKVADMLPDLGNPKANWKQNSSVLRKIMRTGKPIRDVSPYPMSNAGFLGLERNLLLNHGWVYNNGFWIFGG